MAKKQPKTEADFTVSISHDDLANFANPTTVKFTDEQHQPQSQTGYRTDGGKTSW